MPKYVCIAAHLSVDELENRYRRATDPIERSHFQIIWLLAQGKRVRVVAEVTGYCVNWIRILARRYNQEGPQAIANQRQYNRGAPTLLSKEQQEQLQQVLEQAAPDGSLWTGRKVAFWICEQTGRKIHPQRGWDYLKRAGLTLLIPRPHHHKADKGKQEAFKQDLPKQVRQVQQEHPQAQVELWCMDEHRIGLKPVIRRVWASRGQRPIIQVQHRYEWLYVYGFLQFAQAVGAGADRHVVLVLDRAGWHSSRMLTVHDGIHLVFLPPYSPELQPAERLWPLTNEAIANRYFKTLDELQEIQARRCVMLQDDPTQICALTHYHWWPKLAS